MSITSKSGVQSEVRIREDEAVEDVARAYILANKMKLSLVPALSDVIRSRRDEILASSALASTALASRSSPVQQNPFDMPIPAIDATNPFEQFSSSINGAGNMVHRSGEGTATQDIWKRFDNSSRVTRVSVVADLGSSSASAGALETVRHSKRAEATDEVKEEKASPRSSSSGNKQTRFSLSISPRSSDGRSPSPSPKRRIKNQGSVERLHSEHERMQMRHKLLGKSVEKMKTQEIISSKFRESVGFMRSSPSAKQANHYGRQAGHSFHDWLYRADMKWAAGRDKETKKRAQEIASMREKEIEGELTFRPELSTASKHSEAGNSTRTKSVFDALYDSRSYYNNKAVVLKQTIHEESMRGFDFSPKLAPRTEKLAKKWRLREDEKIGLTTQGSVSCRTTPTNRSEVHVLMLEDLLNSDVFGGGGAAATIEGGGCYGDETPLPEPSMDGVSTVPTSSVATDFLFTSTNPFDEFLLDKQEEQPVQKTAYLRLSFFDSFIATSTPQTGNHFMDTFSFDETKDDNGMFSLQELAGQATIDMRNTDRSKLFDRLHRHDVSEAVESARKKHVQLFSHKPDITKMANRINQANPEQFYERLSKRDPPKSTEYANGPTVKVGKKNLKPHSEDELVKRLTISYPKKSENLRQNALVNIDKSIESLRSVQMTDSRSEEIARRARHASLKEIFQLLLLSVDFFHQTEETKKDGEQVGESQSGTLGILGGNFAGKLLLDTRYVMPALLQPKSLVDAVSIVICDSYPDPLSRKAFIEAMDRLIFHSGKCAPISAHLSAPDRSHNTSVAVSSKRKGHKLDLKARGMTERLANRRRGARLNFRDPCGYAAAQEQKIAALRSKLDEENLKDCTFMPVLPSSDTYVRRKPSRANLAQGGVLRGSEAAEIKCAEGLADAGETVTAPPPAVLPEVGAIGSDSSGGTPPAPALAVQSTAEVQLEHLELPAVSIESVAPSLATEVALSPSPNPNPAPEEALPQPIPNSNPNPDRNPAPAPRIFGETIALGSKIDSFLAAAHQNKPSSLSPSKLPIRMHANASAGAVAAVSEATNPISTSVIQEGVAAISPTPPASASIEILLPASIENSTPETTAPLMPISSGPRSMRGGRKKEPPSL